MRAGEQGKECSFKACQGSMVIKGFNQGKHALEAAETALGALGKSHWLNAYLQDSK